MSVAPVDLLGSITNFSRRSRDFNGIPAGKLMEDHGLSFERLAMAVEPLILAGDFPPGSGIDSDRGLQGLRPLRSFGRHLCRLARKFASAALDKRYTALFLRAVRQFARNLNRPDKAGTTTSLTFRLSPKTLAFRGYSSEDPGASVQEVTLAAGPSP